MIILNKADNFKSNSRICDINDCMIKENRLTPREVMIAKLLYERYDYETIGEKYGISRNTVKTHVSRIYSKLNVKRKKEFLEFIDSYKFPAQLINE